MCVLCFFSSAGTTENRCSLLDYLNLIGFRDTLSRLTGPRCTSLKNHLGSPPLLMRLGWWGGFQIGWQSQFKADGSACPVSTMGIPVVIQWHVSCARPSLLQAVSAPGHVHAFGSCLKGNPSVRLHKKLGPVQPSRRAQLERHKAQSRSGLWAA